MPWSPRPQVRWSGYPATESPPTRACLCGPPVRGEDILNLNVWTAGTADGLKPVLVWIHGGGFFAGCSANPWYDGTSFARRGLVVVSINYRLGAEGFMELGDAPSNRGLLDCIAALKWVRGNIAAFGGDPGRGTVMGQSAGGTAVAASLVSAAAHGLFQQAVIASGISRFSAWPADQARAVTDAIAAHAGVEATRAGLASRGRGPRRGPLPRCAGRLPAAAICQGRGRQDAPAGLSSRLPQWVARCPRVLRWGRSRRSRRPCRGRRRRP
jgi:para-nitrobenzyl esterase